MTKGLFPPLKLAAERFLQIDGTERAAAFAYNALFSIFPLLILAVTVASFFVRHSTASQLVIQFAQSHVPLSDGMRKYIFSTISGVVAARSKAGFAAAAMLLWAAPQFLSSLIHACNRAWGEKERVWWRLPLKSTALLAMMAATVVVGMGVPAMVKIANKFFPEQGFFSWAYTLAAFLLPWLAFFMNISVFYRFASRRGTRFSEVWLPALLATALLQAAQRVFVVYLTHFAALNAVYGAFGGIMALLLWVYLSGCIFIYCACLCSALADLRTSRPEETWVI